MHQVQKHDSLIFSESYRTVFVALKGLEIHKYCENDKGQDK